MRLRHLESVSVEAIESTCTRNKGQTVLHSNCTELGLKAALSRANKPRRVSLVPVVRRAYYVFYVFEKAPLVQLRDWERFIDVSLRRGGNPRLSKTSMPGKPLRKTSSDWDDCRPSLAQDGQMWHIWWHISKVKERKEGDAKNECVNFFEVHFHGQESIRKSLVMAIQARR